MKQLVLVLILKLRVFTNEMEFCPRVLEFVPEQAVPEFDNLYQDALLDESNFRPCCSSFGVTSLVRTSCLLHPRVGREAN